MKKLAIMAVLLLCGCASEREAALTDYAKHNWKYRQALYAKNCALTADQKTNEYNLTGAAADVDPLEVQSAIEKELPNGN